MACNQHNWFRGVIGRYPCTLKTEGTHYFFNRPYKDIVVSWRLNSAGRLDTIEGKWISRKKSTEPFVRIPFVEVNDYRNNEKKKEWLSENVVLYPFPDDIACGVTRSLIEMALSARYASLVSWGHRMIAETVCALNQGTVQASRRPLPEYEHEMRDLPSCRPDAWSAMKTAAGLVPRFFYLQENVGSIQYSIKNQES